MKFWPCQEPEMSDAISPEEDMKFWPCQEPEMSDAICAEPLINPGFVWVSAPVEVLYTTKLDVDALAKSIIDKPLPVIATEPVN